MAFKVKTTAPKYCVKPNTGFVQAGATQVVHVIMQSQREWPADINGCKDKFLVQSCASGGSTDFTELFAKGKEGLSESSFASRTRSRRRRRARCPRARRATARRARTPPRLRIADVQQ